MKNNILYNVLCILLFCFTKVWAQEHTNSLVFAHPMQITPAFLGFADGKLKANASYYSRNIIQQITSTQSALSSGNNSIATLDAYVFSANLPIESKYFNGGLGILAGTTALGGIRRTQFLAGFSYEVPLGVKVRYDHLRFGLHAGLVQYGLITNNLRFEDQFNGTDFSKAGRENFESETQNIADINIGLMWYRTEKIKGNPEFIPFFSVGMQHVNQPVVSFYGQEIDGLSPRYTVIGGFKQKTRLPLDFNASGMFIYQNMSYNFVFSAQARYIGYASEGFLGPEKFSLIAGSTIRPRLSIAPYLGAEYKKQYVFGIAYDVAFNTREVLPNNVGGFQVFVSYNFDTKEVLSKGTPFPVF